MDFSKATVRRTLQAQEIQPTLQDANHWLAAKTGWPAKKYLKEQPQFWKKVSWTDEMKINIYQSDGKSKVWRRKETAQDPKHTTLSVKHGGGVLWPGHVWLSKVPGSFIMIDELTADGKMNSEVYRHIQSPQVQVNA